jgi:hypothetical protein
MGTSVGCLGEGSEIDTERALLAKLTLKSECCWWITIRGVWETWNNCGMDVSCLR